MRIVIIGGNGQLGRDLVRVFRGDGEEVIALSRADLDVTEASTLRERLGRYHPDVIVNCSVHHPVDECERNLGRSFAVNAIAVRDLGLAAKDLRAKLVHFSSDYVFDGELGRPYGEDDSTNPINAFGVSKVAGELLLQGATPFHFIIRTSGLYGLAGSRVKRGNFVETMLRLGGQNGQVRVVNDLRMAQTSTQNLARQVLTLVRSEHYGLYHASDHGDYSWFEFAERIFDYARMNVAVTPISWREVPSLARRPRCSVLENGRLGALGLDQMQPIDTALQAYLRSRNTVSASGNTPLKTTVTASTN